MCFFWRFYLFFHETPLEFEEKREIGENDYYIYQLIRDDLVDEFIVYITKTIFH